MTLETRSTKGKREIKAIARYISSLPPLEKWIEADDMNVEVATKMKLSWIYLGKAIEAFFLDESNPANSPSVERWLKDILKEKVPIYTSLINLFFEAEDLIKTEAQEAGLDCVASFKRSDMLKIWAYEHSRYEAYFWLQDFWESESPKKSKDKISRAAKYLLGKVTNERNRLELERWLKEDAKLYRPQARPFVIMCPWICFFWSVFDKHKKELVTYTSFINAMSSVSIPKQKFFLENGQISEYPGRGRGRTSN